MQRYQTGIDKLDRHCRDHGTDEMLRGHPVSSRHRVAPVPPGILRTKVVRDKDDQSIKRRLEPQLVWPMRTAARNHDPRIHAPHSAHESPRLPYSLHGGAQTIRSEEHTSELQSLMRISYAVLCLKKNIKQVLKTTLHNNSKLI